VRDAKRKVQRANYFTPCTLHFTLEPVDYSDELSDREILKNVMDVIIIVILDALMR